MELMQADKQPFIAATESLKARYYNQEFDPIKFTSRRKDGSQGKYTWTQRALWKSNRRQLNF